MSYFPNPDQSSSKRRRSENSSPNSVNSDQGNVAFSEQNHSGAYPNVYPTPTPIVSKLGPRAAARPVQNIAHRPILPASVTRTSNQDFGVSPPYGPISPGPLFIQPRSSF